MREDKKSFDFLDINTRVNLTAGLLLLVFLLLFIAWRLTSA